MDFEGQVEVISSIDENKNNIPNDLRWGVYIVIKAQNEYSKNCFKEYGMITDKSGIILLSGDLIITSVLMLNPCM